MKFKIGQKVKVDYLGDGNYVIGKIKKVAKAGMSSYWPYYVEVDEGQVGGASNRYQSAWFKKDEVQTYINLSDEANNVFRGIINEI